MNTLAIPADALGLGAALAVGLLIGLERGWHERELRDGGRVAGLRTFALTGLLGGVLGSLLPDFGPWPLLGGVLDISLLLAVSYFHSARSSGNLSATSAVALLLTLSLGAFAACGEMTLALAAAVIVAVLLDLKPTLHGWLRLIEHRELSAALQLLVLSVVVLPTLPNTGFGPHAALNPYQLWWAVILIAGLSLAGHFAMRLSGSQHGLLWTGMLGGLASSTAATLTLARYARQKPALSAAATAGALAACAIMFFRIAILLGAIAPVLLKTFGTGLIVTGAVMLGLSLWAWRRLAQTPSEEAALDIAPFDLGTALGFGAFLAVMAVLVPAARQWLGTGGLYALSAVSGLADVDAIVISLARLHGAGGLPTIPTLLALSLAVLANLITKVSMARSTGGAQMGRGVLKGYAISLLAGTLALMLSVYLS